MVEVIMENLVNIVGALVVMLLGVLGTWLTARIGESVKLKNINAAQQEVITMTQITVGELQQTVVKKLKEAREDGKLTKAEIGQLSKSLLELTVAKLSDPCRELLNAAGVDVIALIQGAGEDWIDTLKERK